MKKRLLAAFALAVLLVVLVMPAFAQETEYFVFNEDEYLDWDSIYPLNDAAAEISSRYSCGVYLAVFEDMVQYGYYNIEEFGEAVYSAFELGYTEGGDGILLVMSMADRDYDLTAYGNYANSAFTDYGKEVLTDKFLGYFRQNDWVGGFKAYIDGCGELLSYAESGEALDVFSADDLGYSSTPQRASTAERIGNSLPIGLAIGVIVALIRGGILKSKMKSAVAATEANEYVCEHGVEMRSVMDQFSHTTVVRQRIERDTGRSGGGGTSVNSGGYSHSSGKF